MSINPIKPTSGELSDVVKLLISSIYLLTPIGLLVYRFFRGESVDTTILLIVIVLIFASAYTVFGEKTINKATDKAKELTGDEDKDDSSK